VHSNLSTHSAKDRQPRPKLSHNSHPSQFSLARQRCVAEDATEHPRGHMRTTLRAIAAATGFFALALQYWLEIHLPRGPGLIASTVNFFSYFTILANSAAALAMLMPLIGRFLLRPSVRTAIAGYLIVVAIAYLMFLRHVGDDRGLERIADQLMHYAMPVLFVIDWIAFVPKGRVPWTMIGTSLIPPLAYGI